MLLLVVLHLHHRRVLHHGRTVLRAVLATIVILELLLEVETVLGALVFVD